SGITPLPWVVRTATHRLVLPLLQNRHSPHSAVYSGITWSPGLTLVTPSPTSTTMPAPSWPSTAGNTPSGSSPDRVNASVWHSAVWVILTSTSPLRGGSTSISTICRGFPASKATAARDFMTRHSGQRGPTMIGRPRASGAIGWRHTDCRQPDVATMWAIVATGIWKDRSTNKQSLRIALTYMSVVIGGGIASGNEVIQFFTGYGL